MLAADNCGEIYGCAATGTIRGQRGTEYFGGLVGGNGGVLQNCYTQGTVSGGMAIGGLVGANGGMIVHCYAASRIVAEGGMFGERFAGGLVGRKGGQVAGCYFLKVPEAGDLDNGQGSPLTAAQMKQQSSFAGWDFTTIWKISEGKDYPRLRWEK